MSAYHIVPIPGGNTITSFDIKQEESNMLLWRKRASDDLLFVLYRIHTSHERTALATARDLFFSLRYSSTKHARVASHRTAHRESPAHIQRRRRRTLLVHTIIQTPPIEKGPGIFVFFQRHVHVLSYQNVLAHASRSNVVFFA